MRFQMLMFPLAIISLAMSASEKVARKGAIDRPAPLGLAPWIMTRGGFHLWCRLPDGFDSTVIAALHGAKGRSRAGKHVQRLSVRGLFPPFRCRTAELTLTSDTTSSHLQ